MAATSSMQQQTGRASSQGSSTSSSRQTHTGRTGTLTWGSSSSSSSSQSKHPCCSCPAAMLSSTQRWRWVARSAVLVWRADGQVCPVHTRATLERSYSGFGWLAQFQHHTQEGARCCCIPAALLQALTSPSGTLSTIASGTTVSVAESPVGGLALGPGAFRAEPAEQQVCVVWSGVQISCEAAVGLVTLVLGPAACDATSCKHAMLVSLVAAAVPVTATGGG